MTLIRGSRVIRIAIRGFGRFRLQSALLVLAALTGTGGVIVSGGYAAAGREKVLRQFAGMGTNVLILTPKQSRAVGGRARTGALVTTLTPADYIQIRRSAGFIRNASPTVATSLRARARDLTKTVTVIGCEPDYFLIRNWTVQQGGLFADDASRHLLREVLLGQTAARDLFGQENPVGQRILLGQVPFVVAGVLAERGQGLDAANEDNQLYVPLASAMRRLMNVSYYASILFAIDSTAHMDNAEVQIRSILRPRHRRFSLKADDFQLQSQKRLLETQLDAFNRLTFFVRWIAASTLAVSTLGIFALLWLAVRNRTREIGTRIAIGASRADVRLQFVAEGLAGAFPGSIAGSVLGIVALCILDARLALPIILPWKMAGADSVLSLLLFSTISFLASTRAVRVLPSVALRNE
jgi:putative ABC transport system permease protein